MEGYGRSVNRSTVTRRARAVNVISETCVKCGVTGFLATTVYKPGFENKHLEAALNGVLRGLNGARFLGFHLEGPFISREKRGMIQESSVCEPLVKVLSKQWISVRAGLR